MNDYIGGYIAGDFKRVCDRCGGVFRASMTFRTWDGLFVCREDWETRHPQDFVRGRIDNQTIPNARPEQVDSIVGPLTTTLTASATAASTSLSVQSSVRFAPGDNIGIICDDGSVRARTVNLVPTTSSLTITSALLATASIGNIVIDYSAVAEPDIG